MADIPLRILMSAIGGSSIISSVSGIASAFGKGGLVGVLAAVTVAAGTAAVAIGVTATKAAGDFQSQLTGLSTGAGESVKNLGMVGDGVLKLATDTGTTTKQLTTGLFQIESSGQHGAAGLEVLKNAAMGAKVGNADLGVVSNATTTIMTDFGIKAANSSIAVNTLIATVSNGKTTMDQLAASLSGVMPTASAAGVSLTDTAAAMATMTGEGVPAAQAATYLRQTIIGLEAPSKQTISALSDVGLKSSDVAAEMKKSLPDALKMITDAVGKKFPAGSADYVNAIKNISGGSKTMQGMLDLTGTHLATFKGNVANITDAVKKGGDSIVGWSQVQGNFNQKMSQGKEVVETLMIGIGQQLLPTITTLVTNILPVVTGFSDWFIKSGILKTGMDDLITGVSTVASTISNLVAIGTSIVSFFQNSEIATDALGVALGGLGGIIALFVASSVANMILSMMDYGLSMLTAVAETVTGAATMTTTFGTMAGMIATSMGTVSASILTTLGPFLLIGAAIAVVVVAFVLAYNHIKPFHDAVNNIAQMISSNFLPVLQSIGGFIQNVVGHIKDIADKIVDWYQKTQPTKVIMKDLGDAVNYAKGFIQNTIGVISSIVGWFQKMKTPIMDTALALTVFFAPALIKAGVEAVINGGKVTATFISSIIKSGTEAVVNGARVTVAFIGSMIKSGSEAIINGAKVTVSFIGSMIKSGVEAVANGAKVTVSFVGSLIATGAEGWASAGKLAAFIGSMIASGTQAVLNGAKVTISFIGSMIASGTQAIAQGAIVTASFIGSMIQAGLKAVIAGAQIVASFVGSLITTAGQAIVTGATMVASLVPAIASVVAQAVIAAVTAIPGLVLGFIAWATTAGAAALATLAAAAPILIIIAVVALLVVGIYLLVTHWQQVITFLRGAWQGFVSWISPAISQVGQFFVNVFNGIKTFLQNAWNFIVNAARSGAILLLDVVIGPIGMLVIFVIQHWSQISAFISAIIASIVVIVQTGWNNLSDSVRNIATGLWNNVTNIFNNAKSMLGNALHGLWDWLNGIMNGWPAEALQVGINIVNGIANGIRNAVGTVTDAIKHVTDVIGSFLPHSPAKQGELSHLNEYGPNLVGGISSGVIQSLPVMANAMKLLTAPIGASLTGQSIALSAASSSSAPLLTRAPVSSIPSATNPSTGTTGAGAVTQNITLTVQIYAQQVDPDELDRIAQYTVKYFGDEIHAQFGNV